MNLIIDTKQTADLLTDFIAQTVKSAGFQRVIVAVSGGVDSATSISLAVRALSPSNVYALLLPYQNWHTEAEKHAQELLGGGLNFQNPTSSLSILLLWLRGLENNWVWAKFFQPRKRFG